jgi:hypothetical protein
MYKGVGANGIRPYDTIEVITFLCVSPNYIVIFDNCENSL